MAYDDDAIALFFKTDIFKYILGRSRTSSAAAAQAGAVSSSNSEVHTYRSSSSDCSYTSCTIHKAETTGELLSLCQFDATASSKEERE